MAIRPRTQAALSPAPKPAETPGLKDRFNRISARLTDALGSFQALVASVLLVVVWALTGPVFNFSDTWQLFINTTTTVVTFWMVFVIQNSANRDAKAIHLKLDELLRVHEAARNELITLEQAPEAVVAQTAEELASIAQRGSADGRGVTQVTVTEQVHGRTAQTKATARATARTKREPTDASGADEAASAPNGTASGRR
jgi:low affinity Fe/Cu permease